MRIRTGDIIKLGPHRLMCGDSGNPAHVAKLFRRRAKPDVVFTSPPYLQQRQYSRPIPCWDTLMRDVFAAIPTHATTQVLVNLGMVHRKGEWMPYWHNWIEWMRSQGWRRHAISVWDKGPGLPLNPSIGRLYPSFEFIFHFNRRAMPVNRTMPCANAGRPHHGAGLREANGVLRTRTHSRVVQSHRVPDDVWRIGRHKSRGLECDHGSVFPVALPLAVIGAYTPKGGVAFDPFCGSGTTLIAADMAGRVGLGMELDPKSCALAVDCFKHYQAEARAKLRAC